MVGWAGPLTFCLCSMVINLSSKDYGFRLVIKDGRRLLIMNVYVGIAKEVIKRPKRTFFFVRSRNICSRIIQSVSRIEKIESK